MGMGAIHHPPLPSRWLLVGCLKYHTTHPPKNPCDSFLSITKIALPNAATGEKDWYQLVQVSADFLKVLKKMTYRDYTQRYQNAQEALEAINNLKIIFSTTDTQTRIRPTVMLPLLSRTKIALRSDYPKIRFFWMLVIASVIITFIVASPFLYRRDEPTPRPNSERAF